VINISGNDPQTGTLRRVPVSATIQSAKLSDLRLVTFCTGTLTRVPVGYR
jgi:hypothetical protein